jgi:hypothetical protein
MTFGEVLWYLLVAFFMVVYFMMLFRVIIDVFRADDLSGWGRAGWLLFLLVLPLVTLFLYVVARGDAMSQREASRRAVPGGTGPTGTDPVTQLAQAHELLESGAITPEEYGTLKMRAMA